MAKNRRSQKSKETGAERVAARNRKPTTSPKKEKGSAASLMLRFPRNEDKTFDEDVLRAIRFIERQSDDLGISLNQTVVRLLTEIARLSDEDPEIAGLLGRSDGHSPFQKWSELHHRLLWADTFFELGSYAQAASLYATVARDALDTFNRHHHLLELALRRMSLSLVPLCHEREVAALGCLQESNSTEEATMAFSNAIRWCEILLDQDELFLSVIKRRPGGVPGDTGLITSHFNVACSYSSLCRVWVYREVLPKLKSEKHKWWTTFIEEDVQTEPNWEELGGIWRDFSSVTLKVEVDEFSKRALSSLEQVVGELAQISEKNERQLETQMWLRLFERDPDLMFLRTDRIWGDDFEKLWDSLLKAIDLENPEETLLQSLTRLVEELGHAHKKATTAGR